MPKSNKAMLKYTDFNIPVSYRITEDKKRLRDALNVISFQGRMDTRNGTSKWRSEALPASTDSITFYQDGDDVSRVITKAGSVIYTIDNDGQETEIKSGLTEGKRHRAITLNGRHLIASEDDGFYQYDGEIFSKLGQQPILSDSVDLTDTGFGPFDTDSRVNVYKDIDSGTFATGTYSVALTWYSTITGFESNYTSFDFDLNSATNDGLFVKCRSVDTSGDFGLENLFIDRIRVYIKNVTLNSEYLFHDELVLDFGATVISEMPSSTQTPPETHGPPPGDRALCIASYRNKIAIVTKEFPNEVTFSEENDPDSFDDTLNATVLIIPGNGPITGIAVGQYDGDLNNPYLVIFKRRSTHLYTDTQSAPIQLTLSGVIGCISQDTILVKNGDIHFLSESGMRVISQGRLLKDSETGEAITLGNGDIDDIFTNDSFDYGLSRQKLREAFSVYYQPLDQYMTWVSEGVSRVFQKTYVYEFGVGGFKPFEFAEPATAACTILGIDGQELVIFGDASGNLYKYSINEPRRDINSNDDELPIRAMAQLYWVPGPEDMDATYNFREFLVKALAGEYEITVSTWLDFNLSSELTMNYDFPAVDAFILDESVLDEDRFGDSREVVVSRNDINRVGESILIQFEQEELYSNLGLVSAQLDISKNGNRNK